MITIFVDLSVIEQELKNKGFVVKFSDSETYFLHLDHPDYAVKDIKISQHFFGRLGAEFLSLRWFIDELRSKSRQLNEERWLSPVESAGPENR